MTIEREHDEAWRELRSRLADHLASMEPDDEVGLAVDDGSGEVPAYVVVDVETGGRLLLEALMQYPQLAPRSADEAAHDGLGGFAERLHWLSKA